MTIDELIDYLKEYKVELEKKRLKFVSALMDIGIDAAMAYSGEYAGMIKFEKQLGDDSFLIASDGQKIIRQWKYKGGIKQAEVSPLLMSEFGSGWLSEVWFDIDGVGQGTFPGQTHAFDEDGWYWTTPDGVRHHSYGEEPTHPLHHAIIEMMAEVERVAKEIFI